MNENIKFQGKEYTENYKGEFFELSERPKANYYMSMPNGRSYIKVPCPFCGIILKAYVWSMAGCGKRCDCGAIIGNWITSKKVKDKNLILQLSNLTQGATHAK